MLPARVMLRTRLFLYLTPFVVILLAGGVYAIVLFARLANTVDTTVTSSYQSFVAASTMSLALAGMDREVSWVVAGSGAGEKNDLMVYPRRKIDQNAFDQNKRRFDENLELLLKASALPGETNLQQVATNYYPAFLKAAETISTLDAPENQRLIYERDVVANGQRINAALENIHDLNHKAILATSQNIRADTREVTRLMIIGTVIALVISVYAGYRLSRSVLQPIQWLTRATRELGEGKLDQRPCRWPRGTKSWENWPWRSTKWPRNCGIPQELYQRENRPAASHDGDHPGLVSRPDFCIGPGRQHVELKNPGGDGHLDVGASNCKAGCPTGCRPSPERSSPAAKISSPQQFQGSRHLPRQRRGKIFPATHSGPCAAKPIRTPGRGGGAVRRHPLPSAGRHQDQPGGDGQP